MSKLELLIPPPLITLMAAGMMWTLTQCFPELTLSNKYAYWVAGFFAFTGILFGLAGLLAFDRAGTTFNPSKPEKGTALVTQGVYKITRNPMYLGLLSGLLAFAFYLSHPLTLFGIVFFVTYLHFFQIIPEERFLLSKYGNSYKDYMKSVRRWI